MKKQEKTSGKASQPRKKPIPAASTEVTPNTDRTNSAEQVNIQPQPIARRKDNCAEN